MDTRPLPSTHRRSTRMEGIASHHAQEQSQKKKKSMHFSPPLAHTLSLPLSLSNHIVHRPSAYQSTSRCGGRRFVHFVHFVHLLHSQPPPSQTAMHPAMHPAIIPAIHSSKTIASIRSSPPSATFATCAAAAAAPACRSPCSAIAVIDRASVDSMPSSASASTPHRTASIMTS